MTASRSLKSLFNLPKPAISVGHTNVKSFGQKNSTFHLPGLDAWSMRLNALSGSIETTALRSNEGMRSPTVNMLGSFGYLPVMSGLFSTGLVCAQIDDR